MTYSKLIFYGLEKFLSTLKSQDLLLYFLQKYHIFKFTKHFELILCIVWDKNWGSVFWIMDIQLF